MEDRFEISILLDYYGSLLTEKQLNIMNLYYNEDLSLGEIAEINKTSRQATHDLIKRCSKQLSAYEDKLKLLKRHNKKLMLKKEIIKKLSQNKAFNVKDLELIENNIDEIINT